MSIKHLIPFAVALSLVSVAIHAEPVRMPKLPDNTEPTMGQGRASPTLGQGLPPDTFAAHVNTERPISASQVTDIIDLKRELDTAMNKHVGTSAKPSTRSIQVLLGPGGVPTPVRTSPQNTTSLVFVDATGAPWPIIDFAAGNTDALALPPAKDLVEKKLHILTLAPKRDFISTNLTVLLAGADAPITLAIVSSKKTVDYRLDLLVQARGPNARAVQNLGSFSEYLPTDLLNAIDGKPNESAQELEVVGGDGETRVWKVGKRFMVRTRLVVTAPAAINAGQGVGDMKVYEIPETPRIIALKNGEQISLGVKGF